MKLWLGVLLLFSLTLHRLIAQTDGGADQALADQDWHFAATEVGLNLKAIQHLEKEKVLMTNDELFQCFEAYLPGYMRKHDRSAPNLPYFITTDALFHAYAWCLQKAVASLEQAHADQMVQCLDVLMKSLNRIDDLVQGDPAMVLAAKERALFVIGVAACLMDLKPDLPGAALKADVEHEVTRIGLALGTGKPARLKLPPLVFSELDYTLFKPTSFYAGDPQLSKYFRAIRWLQLVPFRLSSDEDMLAAAMINLARDSERLKQLKLNPKVSELWDERERSLASLAGPAKRLEVLGYIHVDRESADPRKAAADWIKQTRDQYGRSLTPYDESRSDEVITSTLQAAMKRETCAYMVSASTLADAVLIEKLSQKSGQFYFPNALSVAAWLGSDYAAELEKADAKDLEIRKEAQKLIDGSDKYPDLHAESMRVLKRLFEPLPPDAPAFMKTRAWQAKTCQTALAAWAQARHIWALQAQPHYSVGAGVKDWPAFIEPLPDFFSGLAGLCSEAERLFSRAREQDDPSIRVARKLREMADEYETPNAKALSPEKRERLEEMRGTTFELLLDAGVPSRDFDYNDPKSIQQVTSILRESADWIEKGEADGRHPIAQKLRVRLSMEKNAPFNYLEETCLRLASLAHKQLRGLTPREEEYKWLRYFGVTLAAFTDCHFTSPRDTVPKAVRVFTNPDLNKALTVGIGRPGFLYVLYPWKGKDVLCRGAVLPYLERHEMQSFTDDEWRARLHHPESPPIQPEWTKPLRVE